MTVKECEAEIVRIDIERRELEDRYYAAQRELFQRRLQAVHARDLAAMQARLAEMPPEVIEALCEPKPRRWHSTACRPFGMMRVFPLRVEWSPDGLLAREVLRAGGLLP